MLPRRRRLAHSSSSRSRREGLSLVEIVIVLSVTIALLALGAGMTYEARSGRRIEHATGALLGDIRRVRTIAAARGEPVWLTTADDVGANEHGYRIHAASDSNPIDEIPLLDGVRFASTDVGRTLRFGPLGAPEAGTTLRVSAIVPNPYYLILDDSDSSETLRVTIQSATGLARIE